MGDAGVGAVHVGVVVAAVAVAGGVAWSVVLKQRHSG